jgi:kinesin family protein 2/24
LEKICNEHEKLVEMILEEEEDLVNGHRQHIDDVVDIVKQEMVLLHDVDKPGSDIEQYVKNLDAILSHKMELISKEFY